MANSQYITNTSVAYPTKISNELLEAPAGKQLLLQSIAAYNSTSTAMDIGILVKLNENFLQFTDAAASKTIFVNNNDEFEISAPKKFHAIGFTVTQDNGVALTYTLKYWDGSSFVTLPSVIAQPDFSSSGEFAIIFNVPLDWQSQSGLYTVKLTATAGPTQDIIANAWSVHYALSIREVPAKSSYQIAFLKDLEHLLESGEALSLYFETANALNSADVTYRINP